MKKHPLFKLIASFVLVGCTLLSSCDEADRFFPESDTSLSDTDEITENKETEDFVDEPVKEENEPVTMEGSLEKLNAVINRQLGVDGIAFGFMESIKSGDKAAVASYTCGEPEYYGFLDEITSFEYHVYPIEVTPDEGIYGYDYLNKYICEIDAVDASGYFPSSTCYYFLATDEYSATGNSVAYFIPFMQAAVLFQKSEIPDTYIRLAEDFLDYFSGTLSFGENKASQFNFNNALGFHFVPHMMYFFFDNGNMQRPYSLVEINSFIADNFDGNKGVSLSSSEDLRLWVQDYSASTSYSPEDKVYGCYNGHGLDSFTKLVTNCRVTQSGIELTIQGYADYSAFAKARTFRFRFAPYTGNDTALHLQSVDVLEDTGLGEAYYSF